MSTRGALLSWNQARSSAIRSRPRHRDGLINRGAAPQVQGRVSMASYSRNVTYGPRCVLDARTNSHGSRSAVLLAGWEQPRIKLPRKGIGWYGTVESLPATLPLGLERVPKMRKRPAGTSCPDWPCECRGDWIRTSDLLNPIQAVAGRKIARASPITAYRTHTSHILRSGTHKIHRFQRVSCSFLQ